MHICSYGFRLLPYYNWALKAECRRIIQLRIPWKNFSLVLISARDEFSDIFDRFNEQIEFLHMIKARCNDLTDRIRLILQINLPKSNVYKLITEKSAVIYINFTSTSHYSFPWSTQHSLKLLIVRLLFPEGNLFVLEFLRVFGRAVRPGFFVVRFAVLQVICNHLIVGELPHFIMLLLKAFLVVIHVANEVFVEVGVEVV